MIVRWGLDALPEVLRGGRRALAAARREPALGRAGAAGRRRTAAGARCRRDRIDDGGRAKRARGDGVLAVGGGSAIDLGKAISAAAELPLVSVPTTYCRRGVDDVLRHPRARSGGCAAAARARGRPGIVYEAELTLDLPRETTVGTALNALAHCAEALYVARPQRRRRRGGARRRAADLRSGFPASSTRRTDLEARTELLRGACHGGAALGGSMLALAHAMAQAVGGRYGLPHGTLNGICLPPALRFNARYAPEAVRRFGEAVGSGDPAARVEELARSAASRASATSACRRTTFRRWPRPRRSARATRRTRTRRRRRRSSSCCARSGSLRVSEKRCALDVTARRRDRSRRDGGIANVGIASNHDESRSRRTHASSAIRAVAHVCASSAPTSAVVSSRADSSRCWSGERDPRNRPVAQKT